jgi:hypothetical protein
LALSQPWSAPPSLLKGLSSIMEFSSSEFPLRSGYALAVSA